MRVSLWALALAVLPPPMYAMKLTSTMHLNPIRKVVMLLQSMSAKVEQERKTETDLYNKFICYCKNSGGSLSKSISEAETKIPQLTTDIKASEEEKAQLSEGLKESQADREAAQSSMREATEIREKDAATFAKDKSEADSNIASIKAAVNALEKGMAGSFIQTKTATNVRNLVQTAQNILDQDKDDVLAFLSGGQSSDYVPQGGQIVGILKQMDDEMTKSLADTVETEESAIADFESLMSAKKKEVAALTKSIESKMTRTGELSVSITQMKNDLEDSEEQLGEDKSFLANLGTSCAQKKQQWEIREKTRGEELQAIAETIKVLNDDDALELFKKTLPSPASSLVQVAVSASDMRKRALSKVRHAVAKSKNPHRVQLDLIVLAFQHKKIAFDKIINMIDQMTYTLRAEQKDDDTKRAFCAKELDDTEDKQKALEKTLADGEAAIASTKDGIANMKDEIAAVTAGIEALDKSVAEATEQRKQENREFKEVMASDSTAKELLNFAKNRLNKFYNPQLYKQAAKTELSRGDRIFENEGGDLSTTAVPGIAGTGISFLQEQSDEAEPETFGDYSKKSEGNNAVLSMVNLLIKDLDKEMATAQTTEKDAQADYETLLKDSAEKRAIDAKSLTEKGSAKAMLEGDLEEHKRDHTSDSKQLKATENYLAQTHSDCDWLLQNYDVRKSARASEVEALNNAKAVLSGADYS